MRAAIPELRCGLCSKPLDPASPFFRATGDFLPKHDALQTFANVPLHWECYEAWAERPQFARHYVLAWIKANRKNPFWWSVYQDEHVYVSVNPMRTVEQASVRLLAVGSDIRVPLPRWAAWLASPLEVTQTLSACEHRALTAVLPALRAKFPSDHALVDAIDPDEKRAPAPLRRAAE